MNGPRDRGYDDAVSAIRNHAEDLGAFLAIWQARDDTKPDAHARRAASGAVDAIDAAIRKLHKIRQKLVSEIRASADATAARVDALLAERAGDDFPRPAGYPEDEPWTRTPDRAVWRAYKGGLVLTVTRLAANGWQAVAEGKGVTERSPTLATRLAAQRWAESRAGGAS
jgi:hypothetical protein